jgi:homoserine O-succinyltransferase/O-acetyltransferase
MSWVDELTFPADPVCLDGRRQADAVRIRDLTISFVNIMPDAAFDTAERSFLKLIEAGAGRTTVRVRRYTLPGVRRSAEMDRRVKSAYRPIGELWRDPPDAVILTGTEPLEADLRAESYWEPLAALLTWCATNTVSTLLSCLAAHAAILLFDGIERRPLPTKLSGVFDHGVVQGHPLVQGLGGVVPLPHSRLNDVPADEIEQRGYSVLLESVTAGWSLSAVVRDRCLFVLNQGHPEYAPTSLLKEYRRDVRRFLDGIAAGPPDIPEGYFTGSALEQMRAHRAALIDAATPEPRFPYNEGAAGVVASWRPVAERLFANWLGEVERRVATRWC